MNGTWNILIQRETADIGTLIVWCLVFFRIFKSDRFPDVCRIAIELLSTCSQIVLELLYLQIDGNNRPANGRKVSIYYFTLAGCWQSRWNGGLHDSRIRWRGTPGLQLPVHQQNSTGLVWFAHLVFNLRSTPSVSVH